ncbi:hypothetical protein [Motilimonas sp. KMU-193]|uniref:hypothetical protein n=1 Tax=Motilimonas sp. KMU-193 TaxID=3388668 RepID=UPI00396B360C
MSCVPYLNLTLAAPSAILLALYSSAPLAACQAQLQAYLTAQTQAYESGQDCISDAEFDRLNQLLTKPVSSLNQPIAGAYVGHQQPMKSLNSTTSSRQLDDFLIPLLEARQPLIIQPKFDGIAVELIYHQGRLHQASTRGDGARGKDITALIRLSSQIPQRLSHPVDAVIYGELFMPKQHWRKINQAEAINYSSARQATAALAHQQTPTAEHARGLNFYPYHLAQPELSNESQRQTKLTQLGFTQVADLTHPIASSAQAQQWLAHWQQQAPLDADIDGVVIKLSSQQSRLSLGENRQYPHWAMAYKPKAKQHLVKIEKVSFSVGRTGKITPLLHFEPIQLGDKTVAKVSAYSLDYLNQHGLSIGKEVNIKLASKTIATLVTPPTQAQSNGHSQQADYAVPYVKAGLCLTPSFGCQQRFKLQVRYTAAKLGLPKATLTQLNKLMQKNQLHSIVELAPFYQAAHQAQLSQSLLISHLSGHARDIQQQDKHEISRQFLRLQHPDL